MANGSLEKFARHKLEALERRRLRRALETTDRGSSARVVSRGEQLVSFACNDYLGLSQHPEVIEAACIATARYGTGAGAARLITGNHLLYTDLEQHLAALKGSEDAVVFGSGYLANIGAIPVVAGSNDLVLADELSHSCILAGANLSRAEYVTFRHNDADDLRRLLARRRARHRHCLVVTEGVFSMEGDLAPLPALATLAAEYDAWLMTDDAHGLGVVGGGRGSTFAHGAGVDVPLQMGTLSKAAGGYGGYVCTSRAVAELLRNRARSFVYSTGLPPGTVAAASKALEFIATDEDLVEKPLARARLFTERLGLPPAQSPIVAILLGTPELALEASGRLRAAGFLVAAIRPPTVPAGTSRLRFAFSAEHSEAEVVELAELVAARVLQT
jgi:8-amino-7-oxononanoate synthase